MDYKIFVAHLLPACLPALTAHRGSLYQRVTKHYYSTTVQYNPTVRTIWKSGMLKSTAVRFRRSGSPLRRPQQFPYYVLLPSNDSRRGRRGPPRLIPPLPSCPTHSRAPQPPDPRPPSPPCPGSCPPRPQYLRPNTLDPRPPRPSGPRS